MNINRLTKAINEGNSSNIKNEIKKIIDINILRLYELLNIRLFDKMTEIILKYVKFQYCDKTKYYLINMSDTLVNDRNNFCHNINQKRDNEQKILEDAIKKSYQEEFIDCFENNIQECSKKRKKCEIQTINENETIERSFNRRDTIHVLKKK